MSGFYKHTFKVLLHVTIFRATSLATEICCKFNAQCYTLQFPCDLSRERNCVSDCLTIESMAKQVARAIVHVVLLCNLEKFVAESKERFNFSCNLKRTKIQLHERVLYVKVMRATCNRSFCETRCTKSCYE